MTCLVVAPLLLLLLFSFSYADGRYAGATLDLGIGARPLALGEAAAAMFGGAEYFRYNPAALGMLVRGEVGLMYAPTFGSVTSPMATFHYIGLAWPAPTGGTIALHWTRYTVDDIPIYPQLSGNSYAERASQPELRPTGQSDGSFSDVEDAFFISFARTIKTTLPLGWLYTDLPLEIPLGLNVKILRQALHDKSASGVGIDLGMMLKLNLATLIDMRPLGDLCFGFSIKDVTRTTLLWNNEHSERIQTTYLTGFAYRQRLGIKDLTANVFWSVQKKYDAENLYGAELLFKGFALRVGRNVSGLTSGAGWHWRRIRIDYAFTTYDFDCAHRLSCAFLL